MSGFRLDRRRDAMRGGTIAVIAPGNSAGSRLYHKLIGNQYGAQMPPTGALSQEQVNVFKAWIDQGAEWPDDLSGEVPSPPPDPKAAQIMEALRAGDRRAFKKLLGENPKAANLKGPGGSTPLMYAALYGDSDSVRLLLDSGADPNLRNEAGATALMWALADAEKTRVLLEYRADANARSDDGRTPLLIAASQHGSGAVVKLLLDHGANPAVKCASYMGEMTPLSYAALAGDETVVRTLIERDTKRKGPLFVPLAFSMRANCTPCVDLLLKSASRDDLNIAMTIIAKGFGEAHWVKMLLDHGADANAKDPEGLTALMLAASSDTLPAETIKTLLAGGADVNARTPKGETALDFAKLRGQTPATALLVKAGAKESVPPVAPPPQPKPAESVKVALQRSIPLLQKTDSIFIQKSGCVSCHNNNLTSMAVAAARKSGVPFDEQAAQNQLKKIGSYLESWRERVLQGSGIPGDSDTVGYILVGLAAENYPPDAATDAMAYYLKTRQWQDGRWRILTHRPPIESNDIQVTATSLRGLQVYGPKAQRASYDQAVKRAADWLTKARPVTTEERAFQLLGLGWAGQKPNDEIINKAARALLAQQRPDGGWSQLPSLASDAYATGQALVALRQAGTLPTASAAYQRGVGFLLKTQLQDGSWHVKSRSIPFQPFFESGFPHGHDQWISAAASNWATMALALSLAPQKE
jgi:ankyrin repeat protein